MGCDVLEALLVLKRKRDTDHNVIQLASVIILRFRLKPLLGFSAINDIFIVLRSLLTGSLEILFGPLFLRHCKR